jgi:glycosyltransferase involved in cell wall biosynthesis
MIRRITQKDARCRLVSQSNAGLPAALNRGFSEARGAFWTWTSDDNRYYPTAIEAMMKELERRPECGMVYTDFQVVDEEGQVKEYVQNRRPDDLAKMNVVGPCFLYRQSVARKVGVYHARLRLVEDWDYWLRLAWAAPICHLSEVHYDYLDHEASLTRRHPWDILEAELKMRKSTPHPEARGAQYREKVARRLATLHWAEGNRFKAIGFRLQSFKHSLTKLKF